MLRLKGRMGWYRFFSLVLGILLLAGGTGGMLAVPALAAGSVDVLYEGPVTLTPGQSFTVKAYNSGAEYTVAADTPWGLCRRQARPAASAIMSPTRITRPRGPCSWTMWASIPGTTRGAGMPM